MSTHHQIKTKNFKELDVYSIEANQIIIKLILHPETVFSKLNNMIQ